MFSKKRKFKKKGSLIIEQIIVFPFMIALIWLIMQMIIFVYANNQVNTAANETAQSMSQMLRGNDKKLTEIATNNKVVIQDESLRKLMNNLEQNKFVMLAEDRTGGTTTEYLTVDPTTYQITGFKEYTAESGVDEDEVLLVVENAELCDSTIKDSGKKRVVCFYTEENVDPTNTIQKNSQQVVVRVKAPFYLMGSIIPGIDDRISLYGNGVSTKGMSGRYQYY